MHPKQNSASYSEQPFKPVKGRRLPKALVDARTSIFYPLNCLDLSKGAKQVLHALLAFFNLETRKAVFPSRAVLGREAQGMSVATVGRYLIELEKKSYIHRLPQLHLPACCRADAGQFSVKPIELQQKALLLVGLEPVIHSAPSIKLSDGINTEENVPKKEQSSSKNTFPAENVGQEQQQTATGFDRATRLPLDLMPLLQRGLQPSAIFCLMRLATLAKKRLSDIVAYRIERIATLDLQGRALFSYLRDRINEDLDYAYLARTIRSKHLHAEVQATAESLAAHLHASCDGYEVVKAGQVVGIIRKGGTADGVRIETEGGSTPVNLKVAQAIARGIVTLRAPAGAEHFHA